LDSAFGPFLIRLPPRFGDGDQGGATAGLSAKRPVWPSLEQIIAMGHPLVRLAGEIDWGFLDRRFGEVYAAGDGQPPLAVRLIAGLFILKEMHSLSDEALCARWVENPYFQYFCGERVFRHELPFDRSSLTRWRQRLGEERLSALLQESLRVAHAT
jgi:IS5 family transposase